MRILHISADFPDSFVPAKTRAISMLIDMVDAQFEHDVISLNRVSPSAGELASMLCGQGRVLAETRSIDNVLACRYRALPKGLLHRTSLLRLADALFNKIACGPRPDLIVGHKLTVEGFVAAELAQRLGVPYALTIQGNTDTRILRIRPDLQPSLTPIFHGAEVVFALAPWALAQVSALLGTRSRPSLCLPCPTDIDTPLEPTMAGTGLVSAFHLRNARLKNLSGMVTAMETVSKATPGAQLAILGGGNPVDIALCRKIVGKSPNITFEGNIDRDHLRQRFNRATAFVLPSLRESFGMVFVEALFCGLPIVYPADRAIDGYFDDLPFAIRVNPDDPRSIATGIDFAIRNEASLKASLAHWQKSDAPDRFIRSTIAAAFADGLMIALRQGHD